MTAITRASLQMFTGIAVGALAVAIAPNAGAQTTEPEARQGASGLEEIIVTAQRREERLQDVPIAVSAITANALAQNGIDTTRDLPQIMPSVQFTRSGASGLFFVRGVGTTNASVGEEGANAVYIDGVYLPSLDQTVNNFNNIERIEVLKGPQGTLFGRNATGGLIHIITREPGDETVLQGQIGAANYETVTAKAYVAGPLTEGISADLALAKSHQNGGWGKALTLDDRKIKVQDFTGARSKIVLRPSDGVKFVASGDYSESADNIALGYKLAPGSVGVGGYVGPSGWDTTLNDYPLTELRTWGVSLTGEADLGFGTLTSISAYRNTRNTSDLDVDAGPNPLLRIQFASGTTSFQQELRLASAQSDTLSWQIGAFYLHTKATNDSSFLGTVFTGRGLQRQAILAELTSNSYAAFGELTWSITPTTQLTGGIRYTEDKRHFVGSQFNVLANGTYLPGGTITTPSGQPLDAPGIQDSRLTYDAVTWRVALRQEITPDINIYASVNRGFKAGSYSLQNPLNDPYLPQQITAYEVGFKSELFDRKLRLNVSGFHYGIDDYQVRSAATANPGSSLVLNAATVKVDGVDLEFEAAPTDGLRVFGGAVWLNSRFKKFGGVGADFQAPITYQSPAICVPGQSGTKEPGMAFPGPQTGGFVTCLGDVSGNRTMNAPEFTASLGASYTVPVSETGEVRLSALYSYNSGYYFEPDNKWKQGAFSLINASVEYKPTENLGIELWGRNLGNKEYAVQMLSSSGLSVSQGLGAPRTYGVNLNFSF